MTTEASISILKNNGEVKSVYCTTDGYVEHTGMILYNEYKNLRKIEQLLRCGQISFLDREIFPPKNIEHTWSNRAEGVCRFFKDRGDSPEHTEPEIYASFKEFRQSVDSLDYHYYFSENHNHWYFFRKKTGKIVLLEEQILKEYKNIDSSTKEKLSREIDAFKEKINLDEKIVNTQKNKKFKI